ncbi:MAG: hypothetical protein IH948_04615, partial [Bacteroidetes bacterium]|nr:hypothetical protein [Bacteroidota bacterium]
LFNIPGTNYVPQLIKRWRELRASGIISNKNFKALVAANDKVIHEAQKKKFIKWPFDGKWYFDNNNYQQEIDLMLQFVELRIPHLDEYFDGL